MSTAAAEFEDSHISPATKSVVALPEGAVSWYVVESPSANWLDSDMMMEAAWPAGRKTNVPTCVSWLAATAVISGVPVVPGVAKVCEATLNVPMLLARSAHEPPGIVTAVSEFTPQPASANAPGVTVVTAGAFGEVSFCLLAHFPSPSNATSCGVV